MSRAEFDALLVVEAEELFDALNARDKAASAVHLSRVEAAAEFAVSLVNQQTKTILAALGARLG